MRIALIQVAAQLDPAANRAALTATMADERLRGADLVVFPEAFARDFGEAGSDVSGFAEPLDGPFGSAVTGAAAEFGTTIVAGMFERGDDPDRPLNTLIVRGRATAEYRKIHLYDSFGYRESDRLSAGPLTPCVVDLPCGDSTVRVGLMTCYDLRFPELARRLVEDGAEVIVVPAAWVAGEHKVDHWRTLVRARAIENTVQVVAVGQPGPRYTGHSMAVDPFGSVIAEADTDEAMLVVDLDIDAVARARRTNPSLSNRRL